MAGNTGASTRTGSIDVQMESGTAVYTITQLCCGSDSVTLTPSNATAPANSSGGSLTGSLAVGTSSNTVAWNVGSVQPCFSSVTPTTTQTGPGTVSYTLQPNTSTTQQTCSFTVTPVGGTAATFTITQAGAPGLSEATPSLTGSGGTYTASLTAGGTYTVSVSNWTGWSVSITSNSVLPNTSTPWLGPISATANSVQYTVPGVSGSATLTFTGGTPSATITLNITESPSGASCAAPTLTPTTLSFPAAGASGQDYSVQIAGGTAWTASCSNAGGEALTFYLSSNPNHVGGCTVPLSGTNTETLYVNVGYNHATPPNALSSTITVTPTCNGTPQSANITVNQGAQTLTVAPSTDSIYQDFGNAPIQFTAYLDGSSTYPTGYSVSWSLGGCSGSCGSIDPVAGLYSPPTGDFTNSGSVNVIATLNQGGVTASAVVSVLANPTAPWAGLANLNGQTGSGGVFQFIFQTLESGTFAGIQDVNLLFSTDAAQNETPPDNNPDMEVYNGAGVYYSTLELNGSPGGTASEPPDGGTVFSPAVLWNANMSVNLQGTTPVVSSSSNPLTLTIPIQFYSAEAGTKGIWATEVSNGATYVLNLFMGTYTIIAPMEAVSPGTVTLNLSGQTQQFTATASGTPIPDVTWNAPNPAVGTISTGGLYTAPNPLSTAQTVTISGKRTSDGSSICCATVTLSPDSVTVSPASVTLYAGQTQTITATVNGTSNQAVTWNTPSAGTFSGGVYTAPTLISSQQTVTLTATSTADPTKTGSVTITLIPVGVSLSPTSASLQINQTQTFTPTVTGTSNQALTWTLSPSGAASGSVSNGLYTAPASIPTGQTVTITATSVADSTKSSSATITLIPDTLAISPSGASLTQGQSQQFTATVTGTTNTYVNWSMNPSVGTLSTGGYYTAPSSVTTLQTIVITATSQADGSLVKSVNVVLNPFTTVAATAGTPQSASISTAFATALQVTVKNTANNPVSGVTVTFTAPGSGASATFSGSLTATATTNSSGVATAPALTANTIAGNYTVTASATGATTPTSFSLTNTPGPAASIAAGAGTPQSATISTAFATALQATVKDSGGNLVSGATVTFTAPSSGAGATFGGSTTATATTNSSGVATAPALTANTTAGNYPVTASVTGVSTSASFSLTNNAGAPASITASAGTPESANIGTVFATALQATVKDSSGNLVSGVTVTFTAPSSGASGAFSGSTTATATTNSNGVATAPAFTANTTSGSYSVTASVSGVGTAASFSLTNNVGAPASVTASAGTPQSITISTAFATALQATVKDSGGNLVSGVTVTFTAPSSGASAKFSGSATATATTNSSGVATAPTLTANATAGSYVVTASVSGVSTSASFSLTNSVGAPASITASAGTPQSTNISTAFATALQATVKDSGGNLVSGATVTFTAPSSGASATFAGSTTAAATTNSTGVATSPIPTANATAGSYTATASVSGVATAASFSLTNINPTPVVVVLTSGTSWTAPAGVTSIKVECVGGGGGGGPAADDEAGGGGGGGAYARRNSMAVTPGNAYAYSIGLGGGSGGSGGTTTFTGNSGVQCVAHGGSGGSYGYSSAPGGPGATTATGDVTYGGGNGSNGSATNQGLQLAGPGAGGGSGGSSSVGNSGSNVAVAGGGPGGLGATPPAGNGSAPSSGPGGGGGGAFVVTGSGSYSGGKWICGSDHDHVYALTSQSNAEHS